MTIQTFEFLSAKGNWKIIKLSHAIDEYGGKKNHTAAVLFRFLEN